MSRKVLKKSFPGEKEAEEKEVRRKDPPEFVPWSNPNELQATDRSTTQRPSTSGSRRVVSSAGRQDTSPGAEALSKPGPGRHHPVFIEETRPGAVAVPGFDSQEGHNNDELTIEEGYEGQATIAPHEESTVHIIAQAVDTEEENRLLRELDQLRQMQIRHERDQLRQILDNAPIVTPVIAANRDVENGDENIHAHHDDLPSSDAPRCGSKGRRWIVFSAILLIVVAVAVTLALVLQPDPVPPKDPLSELLSSASSDGGVALADPSTPQNMALRWLAGNPNLASYTDQQKIQRYALATLYYTTKGDSWTHNDYWLSDEDVCGKWYQYELAGGDMVVDCTSYGAVSAIGLSNNNLQGVVPPEIGMLSDSMDALYLANNELDGTLPTEIGELTKLSTLNLFNNSFTGAISSVIGLLTNLEALWLADNELEGDITTEIGELTKLTSLTLLNNSFTGAIPTVIGLLTNLEGLWLYNNALVGDIPTGIGELTKLTTLELNNNALVGDIGPIINELPQRLVSLELDDNLLTGTIPPSIGTFTDLDFLGFGTNNLSGKIPTELGLLTKLTYLNLGPNEMTGTIPNELGLLTKLTWLTLSQNGFTGTVPTSLASLPLLGLFLDGNDLTGSLEAFCNNSTDFEYFVANTCDQEDEMNCTCCTHCCDVDGYCEPV